MWAQLKINVLLREAAFVAGQLKKPGSGFFSYIFAVANFQNRLNFFLSSSFCSGVAFGGKMADMLHLVFLTECGLCKSIA